MLLILSLIRVRKVAVIIMVDDNDAFISRIKIMIIKEAGKPIIVVVVVVVVEVVKTVVK